MKKQIGLVLLFIAGWGCSAQRAAPETTSLPTTTLTSNPAPTQTVAPVFTSTPASIPSFTPTPNPTSTPSPAATHTPEPVITPDFSQGAWRMGMPMPQPARSEMPAVTLNELIYVPGGFGGFERLEAYNPQTDRWQPLAPLPAGRHHLMASAFDGRLYLFGGAQAGDWAPTDTVWQYDPAMDRWRELLPMPEARLAGAAVPLDDKIYIVGGAGGSEALLAYTPAQETWQLLPAPAQPREHVSAVAFEGEIWLFGGRWPGVGELATVEIYNPDSLTWRAGPSLNVARAGFAAAVVSGHIIVAGGEVILNGTETLDSVEFLSSGSAAWQVGPKLPMPIHGVGGAPFESRFLLLGGSLRAGAIENEGQVQIYEP